MPWDRSERDRWADPPPEPREPACEVCGDTCRVDGEPCTECPHCMTCGGLLSVGDHRRCWEAET